MHFARPRYAPAQRGFGRGPAWTTTAPASPSALSLSDDVKLFASTFAAGFLFVTLYLA